MYCEHKTDSGLYQETLTQARQMTARAIRIALQQRGAMHHWAIKAYETALAEKDNNSPPVVAPRMALVPAVPTGNGSGQFTVNTMYVSGQVTGIEVAGNTATLKGMATITGLGAGTNVPFTFVVPNGGPESTSVLTVPGLTFHEILLAGAFEVGADD